MNKIMLVNYFYAAGTDHVRVIFYRQRHPDSAFPRMRRYGDVSTASANRLCRLMRHWARAGKGSYDVWRDGFTYCSARRGKQSA